MKGKIIAGAAVIALTLTTGIAAYAANAPQEESKDEISFEDIDKTNLPEGVLYQDEVSMTGEESISFDAIDKDNLPEGVVYLDEVSPSK